MTTPQFAPPPDSPPLGQIPFTPGQTCQIQYWKDQSYPPPRTPHTRFWIVTVQATAAFTLAIAIITGIIFLAAAQRYLGFLLTLLLACCIWLAGLVAAAFIIMLANLADDIHDIQQRIH